MPDLMLPDDMVRARRTALFDHDTIPGPLAGVHRAAVWATLHVHEGSVRYSEFEGGEPRDVRVEAGNRLAIAPRLAHHIEPSTDARFFVQFHRAPGDPFDAEGDAQPPTVGSARPWERRGRDLDTTDEVAELVTRQYVSISEDPVLARYFAFGGSLTDWYSQVLAGTDFWSSMLFEPPNRQVDAVLERFRRRHEREPFTPEAFDRWLEIFHTTVDDGWTGANAEHLKRRATGLAWAVASRTLGKGAWRPGARR